MPRPLPVPREAIVELLQRGDMTETAIAAQLGVSRPTVAKVRTDIGLPAPRLGYAPHYPTFEDAYLAGAVVVEGGHAHWTGVRAENGTPMIKHCGKTQSVYRIAFRVHHGREPEGIVTPSCRTPGCVAGSHVADTPMRRAREEAKPVKLRVDARRSEIVALLGEGHSDREIGRRLQINPKRVGRIRAELELPHYEPAPGLSLEQRWEANTRPVGGGHVRWAGKLRDGMPNLVYRQRNYSARRVAFRLGHGRDPVGRVLPGCGQSWCIAPEHTTDGPMRRADNVFAAVFGRAA